MTIERAPPLAARATASPLLLALLPALAVAVLTAVMNPLGLHLAEKEVADQALADLAQRARAVAADLDDTLRGLRSEVRLLARSPLLQPGQAPDVIRAELEQLRRGSEAYVWAGLVAPDGTVLAGTQSWLEGRSIASRPVFLGGLAASYVGDVHPSVALAALLEAGRSGPAEVLDLGEPVRDAQGRVVAVLAVHLGTAWVDHIRSRAAVPGERPETMELGIHVLTGSSSRSVVPGPGLPAGLHLSAPVIEGEFVGADGRRYLGASTTLGRAGIPGLLPWRIVSLQDRDTALAPATRVGRTVTAFGLVVTVLLSVAGLLLARRLLRPWGPMFEAVQRRAGEHADARSLAEAVDAVLKDAGDVRVPSAAPEILLARLAQGTRDLRRVIDHLPVGLALIDRRFRVEYLNPEYTRLLGWTTDQVRGRIAAEFLFDAVERAEFVRIFQQFGRTPGPVAARFEARRSDGGTVAVQWHLVPMLGLDGGLEGAIAIVSDIRPELAARARGDALAGRLRALADAAVDDALATLDLDGRVLEWSRGAERLSGHGTAQALGRPLGELLPPAEALSPLLAQARREGRCAVALEMQRADGQRRWVEGSIYALGLAPGSARFGLILRDLTEQREVHRELERSEARLRLALEAARMGIWEIRLDRPVFSATWSDGLAALTGLPRCNQPTTAPEILALIHPEDRERVAQAVMATARDDEPLAVEVRTRRDGAWRWILLVGHLQRHGDGGRARRIMGLGMDVTERHEAEAEIRSGRERLELIVQTMAEGLVMLDAEGRYVLANRAAQQMLGLPAAQIVGRRYDDVPWRRLDVQGEDLPPAKHAWVRLRDGAPEVRGETMWVQSADRRRLFVAHNAQPIRDADGTFAGVVLTFVDITDRHLIQQALADNEARMSAIVGGASDAIVSTDIEGRISLFNAAAERIFGHAAADMVGRTIDVLLPPGVRDDHRRHLAGFAATGDSQRAMAAGRVRGVHASGLPLELEASISQARIGGELVLTAVLRDITQRVAQERALENVHAELTQLTQRLLEQEKQTTRRLAQALHDELGQTLTALRLHWEALQTADAQRVPALRERLGHLVVTANRQIRGVLGELRPPLLDDFGLAAALDNELQQRRPVDGVPVLRMEVPPRLQAQRWPADVEYAAFMVAREALVNALHHAQAGQVLVALDGDEGELQLRVQDDGVGLALDAGGRPGHLGLVGMRERAQAIGATLQLTGRPGRGTVVSLNWNAQDEPDLPGR